MTYTKGHCYQWHKAHPDPHFLPRNQANGHISIAFNGRTATNGSMYQIPCAETRQTQRSKGEGRARRGPATWDSSQTTPFANQLTDAGLPKRLSSQINSLRNLMSHGWLVLNLLVNLSNALMLPSSHVRIIVFMRWELTERHHNVIIISGKTH